MVECCISFDSYIKPQLMYGIRHSVFGCISFDSYIKPQLTIADGKLVSVVYLLIPTSNHNYRFESTDFQCITITSSNKKWRAGYNFQCKSTKKTPIE